jgi:hypothetical protein
MTDLYLHRRKVDSVFQLLGEHENDISYSVAWALARCPSFLRGFLHHVLDWGGEPKGTEIRLQQPETNGGITDIEIEESGSFYLIGEAKRGWNVPSQEQLKKYAMRPSFVVSSAPLKRLVVLSECSRQYAELCVKSHVEGIPVVPVSWKNMIILAERALAEGSHAEKRLVRELLGYLRGIMRMQDVYSNWVYVVSVANGTPPGWEISWIDIVRNKGLYFHPVGAGHSGWPKEPPNYIAFRYYGRLQSIHHIDNYEVVTNMHQRIPEIPDGEWGPFFLYTLGSAFSPDKQVQTGRIYPSGRVWCMLDTLFTSNTISEARDASRARSQAGTELAHGFPIQGSGGTPEG